MTFNQEKWMPIVGWDGLYEISSAGRVRSNKRVGETSFGKRAYGGNEVKPLSRPNGYMVVNLTKSGMRKQILVHRAVLEAFLGACPTGFQACHNNGIRSDNRLENLRWDSVSNNHADKELHGTSQKGESNPAAKLNESAVAEIRASNESISSLSERLGVSRGCVEKVKYKATWKHV